MCSVLAMVFLLLVIPMAAVPSAVYAWVMGAFESSVCSIYGPPHNCQHFLTAPFNSLWLAIAIVACLMNIVRLHCNVPRARCVPMGPTKRAMKREMLQRLRTTAKHALRVSRLRKHSFGLETVYRVVLVKTYRAADRLPFGSLKACRKHRAHSLPAAATVMTHAPSWWAGIVSKVYCAFRIVVCACACTTTGTVAAQCHTAATQCHKDEFHFAATLRAFADHVLTILAALRMPLTLIMAAVLYVMTGAAVLVLGCMCVVMLICISPAVFGACAIGVSFGAWHVPRVQL